MRKLTVTLAFLAAAAGAGVGCSSDTGDGTGGLSGGASGTAAKGGTGNTSSGATGGSTHIGTGGSISVGGSSGSSGASSSGSSGTSIGGACTGTTANGEPGAGAVVLFLVDTSLSMNETVRGTTKIAATRTALDGSFTQLSSALEVGLVFFPHVDFDAAACFDPTVEVPIAPLDAAQVGLLTDQVNAAVPNGATPTHDAFKFAVQTLQQTTAMGDKYIVLITDGIPTYAEGCVGNGMPMQTPPVPTQPLIDAAAAAFMTDGIKTFVVGSPGSENARSALSAMARVGGTGKAGCADSGTPSYCHFDMTQTQDFAASLEAALGQITQQIPVDCAFDLPDPPSGMQLDTTMVNVTVTHEDGTTQPINKDPGDDCATEGWVYTGGNPVTGVKLCGALCDAVRAEKSSIIVQYGCSQRVNPPR